MSVVAIVDAGLRDALGMLGPLAALQILVCTPALTALAVGWLAVPAAATSTEAAALAPFGRAWALATAVAVLLQALFEPLSWAVAHRWAADRAAGRGGGLFAALAAVSARLDAVAVVGAGYGLALAGLGMAVVAGLVGLGTVGFLVAAGRPELAMGAFAATMTLGVSGAGGLVVVALRYGFALPMVADGGGWRTSFARSSAQARGGYARAVRLLGVLWTLRVGVAMLAMLALVPWGPSLDVLGGPESLVAAAPDLVRWQLVQQGAALVGSALFAPVAATCWSILMTGRPVGADLRRALESAP